MWDDDKPPVAPMWPTDQEQDRYTREREAYEERQAREPYERYAENARHRAFDRHAQSTFDAPSSARSAPQPRSPAAPESFGEILSGFVKLLLLMAFVAGVGHAACSRIQAATRADLIGDTVPARKVSGDDPARVFLDASRQRSVEFDRLPDAQGYALAYNHAFDDAGFCASQPSAYCEPVLRFNNLRHAALAKTYPHDVTEVENAIRWCAIAFGLAQIQTRGAERRYCENVCSRNGLSENGRKDCQSFTN